MKPSDALILALIGVFMVALGFTWLFGPYGLIGSGIAIAVTAIVIVDLKPEHEEEREEPLL